MQPMNEIDEEICKAQEALDAMAFDRSVLMRYSNEIKHPDMGKVLAILEEAIKSYKDKIEILVHKRKELEYMSIFAKYLPEKQ